MLRVACKIKVDEDDSHKMKARICPHGHRDKDKEGTRKANASAQFPNIRLMLSVSALFGFQIGSIDISAAYQQSGPITGEIFVRPPKEHHRKRGKLWKLLQLLYGIAEACRLWQTTCEAWLTSQQVGFRNILGIKKPYECKISTAIERMTLNFGL